MTNGRNDNPLAHVFNKEWRPTKSTTVVRTINTDVELRRSPTPSVWRTMGNETVTPTNTRGNGFR